MTDRNKTKPEINKFLLKATMEQIEQHPELWDQDVWLTDCGTKACFAGWASKLSGFKPVVIPASETPLGEIYVSAVNEDDVHVSDWAAEKLGLTSNEVDVLFDGSNSMGDLRRYVSALLDDKSILDEEEDTCCEYYIAEEDN